MSNQSKEIQIKAVKVEDSKIGPRIGICDMTGAWYNSNKKAWDKKPGAWDVLAALQRGERLDLTWEVRSYVKDGATKYTNDIIGFEKVLRPEDEVRPPDSPAQESPRRDTPPTAPVNRDDIIAKQTCLKAGAEMVAAQIRAGVFGEMMSPDEVAVSFAKKLFASLKAQEAW